MGAVMFWSGTGEWAFWQVAVMWVGMLAVWGWVFWAIHVIAKGGRGQVATSESSQPTRILDERLARGEVDADEYGRVKALLSAGAAKDRSSHGGRS